MEAKDLLQIANKLGFENSYAVNRVGKGGSFAIMWKRTVDR